MAGDNSGQQPVLAASGLRGRVEPRPDVLSGALSDAIFAASLDEVVAGTAPAAYGDPAAFFAATHPSAGIKTLLAETLGRLSGCRPDAPPIIRLETNLGGGKTHSLIAAYHAALRGLNPLVAPEFVDVDLLPAQPVRVGVFVGTGSGAISFAEIDGVRPHTPGRLCVLLSRHRQACVVVGRSTDRGLLDGVPPATPGFFGWDPDPVLDGWDVHAEIFRLLEPHVVAA